MKILSGQEIPLRMYEVHHYLPHAAVELETVKEYLGDERLYEVTTPSGKLTAYVFKPGGDRFILKNFTLSKMYVKSQPKWYQKLITKLLNVDFECTNRKNELTANECMNIITSIIKENLGE